MTEVDLKMQKIFEKHCFVVERTAYPKHYCYKYKFNFPIYSKYHVCMFNCRNFSLIKKRHFETIMSAIEVKWCNENSLTCFVAFFFEQDYFLNLIKM